jgi:hypothetical protein
MQLSLTVGGTPATSQVYSVLMGLNNAKVVSYAATSLDTNSTIAAALQLLLAATTMPEYLEVIWSYPGTGAVITATAFTPGVPVTISSSATGTGTFVTATTVASSGPNAWDTASNWSLGTVPVSTNAVFLTGANSIFYGLPQSGVTLASLTADSTFTGQVGLPPFNAGNNSNFSGGATGSSGYAEYRPQFLAISPTTLTLGGGSGAGSGFFKIDGGTVAFATIVYSMGSPAVQGYPALQVKGTNASNTIIVLQGNVGVAINPGETAAFDSIELGYETQQATDANVVLGSGVTLTSCPIVQNGGTLTFSSTILSLLMNAGTATGYLSSAITTLNAQSGTYHHQSSGTITTTTVGAAGTLDLSQDPRQRTLGNTTVNGGGTLNDPNKTAVFTNPVLFPDGVGGKNGANINFGTNFSLQRS